MPALVPNFSAVCILNMYAVHDLNGLDAYILYTVHEQDSMVMRHKKTMPYTAHNVICVYIVSMLFTSILQNFSSDSSRTRVQMSS